jgi:hypothetical protein
MIKKAMILHLVTPWQFIVEKLYVWVKWAPNLADFAAAFCSLRTHARQGSRALISCSLIVAMPCEAQELVSGNCLSNPSAKLHTRFLPHITISYNYSKRPSKGLDEVGGEATWKVRSLPLWRHRCHVRKREYTSNGAASGHHSAAEGLPKRPPAFAGDHSCNHTPSEGRCGPNPRAYELPTVCQSPSGHLLKADPSWVYSVEDCTRNRYHRPHADICEYYSQMPYGGVHPRVCSAGHGGNLPANL